MIKVNGARIDWDGYEFAVRRPDDGTIKRARSYGDALAILSKIPGSSLLMRARYVTGWDLLAADSDETRDWLEAKLAALPRPSRCARGEA